MIGARGMPRREARASGACAANWLSKGISTQLPQSSRGDGDADVGETSEPLKALVCELAREVTPWTEAD